MMQIKFPRNLSLNGALRFCSDLWQLEDAEAYEVDFSSLGFIEPFTMAYVANELKRYRKTKPSIVFQGKNYEGKSYAAHMGFFKAIGMNVGNAPGEAPGSHRYLPLTYLSGSELAVEAARSNVNVGDVIEDRAHGVAGVLARQGEGDLVDTLTFSIREIMRNAVEHSDSDEVEYCAQFWPTKDLVEVAILDTGSGIKASLSENPHLAINDERDALHLALLPGVSGKMFKGVKKRRNDEWQNSGFGLYMTSRICRNGGDFLIISNDKGIHLNGSAKQDLECNYHGTALRLRIKSSDIRSYSEALSKYRREGFEAQKAFTGDAIEPSLASTMLTKDFYQR